MFWKLGIFDFHLSPHLGVCPAQVCSLDVNSPPEDTLKVASRAADKNTAFQGSARIYRQAQLFADSSIKTYNLNKR